MCRCDVCGNAVCWSSMRRLCPLIPVLPQDLQAFYRSEPRTAKMQVHVPTHRALRQPVAETGPPMSINRRPPTPPGKNSLQRAGAPACTAGCRRRSG
eukprot:gene14567-biopygen5124